MRALLPLVLLAACGSAPEKPPPKERCTSASTPLRAVVPDGTKCLEFPEAEIGVGSFARLQLINDATADRAITLDFSDDSFQQQSDLDGVSACGTAELDLAFLPHVPGVKQGKLTVNCDGCQPLTACLKGTAVPRH